MATDSSPRERNVSIVTGQAVSAQPISGSCTFTPHLPGVHVHDQRSGPCRLPQMPGSSRFAALSSARAAGLGLVLAEAYAEGGDQPFEAGHQDRKSTRLNSS